MKCSLEDCGLPRGHYHRDELDGEKVYFLDVADTIPETSITIPMLGLRSEEDEPSDAD